jgi:hypothetical protein
MTMEMERSLVNSTTGPDSEKPSLRLAAPRMPYLDNTQHTWGRGGTQASEVDTGM